MNSAMFPFFNLGVGEIIFILMALMVMAVTLGGIILLVVFLARRGQRGPPPPPPPVQSPSSPPTTPAPTCPRCGSPLPPGAPQGLCPRCVMGVGLAKQTETGGECGPHGTKIVPPPEAEVARRFPQLEIIECLGHGGMGVVYKARQPKLDRIVALKILKPEKGADPKFAERFQREAQALARLNHPNIVTVHDFGEADGMFFLLMEYVDGMTLRQLLREGRVKPEQALAIVPRICEALQFAHEQGVVHRDIKPENVLLDKQGRVKIADFGIAKILQPGMRDFSLTGAKEVVGTPHYMAPEQIEKPQEVDHRADIYSLGVVFYEMLTGELPLGKFLPPSGKVQVDVRLDEVVLHALEKEPNRRYQHASEVKTDVERIADTAPPPPLSAPSGSPPAPDETQLAAVRRQVRVPAIGVFIAGCVDFAAAVLVLVLAAFGLQFLDAAVLAQLAPPRLSPVPLVALLFIAGVVIIGASQMRRLASHNLAVVASILAVVLPPGAWIGLPFGIWSLVVLTRSEVRQAFDSTAAGHGSRGERRRPPPPFWLIVVALCAVVFFSGVVLGVAVIWALPWGGKLNLALFALMVAALPFIAVIAVQFVRRLQSAVRPGQTAPGALWLQAWAWMAWALAVPVVGFGLFFLGALLSQTGGWNPAPDEAVLVPLTWLGSMLLPISGWVLLRAASPASSFVANPIPRATSGVASQVSAPRWLVAARWTARILGTVLLAFYAIFILAEGLPPVASQPGGVQLSFAALGLMLLGFVVGWKREGAAALFIASGWTLWQISENSVRWNLFQTPLPVAGLYACCWWAMRGRRTRVALAVIVALAVAFGVGRLFCPTNVFVRGAVTDAATGKPIAGATLTLLPLPPGRSDHRPNARADANGQFRLYMGWYSAGRKIAVAAPEFATLTTTLGPRAPGERNLSRQFQLRPANPNSVHAVGTATTPTPVAGINLVSSGEFQEAKDPPASPRARPFRTTQPVPGTPTSAEGRRLMAWVEDFFRHNYRDITARAPLEWGDVSAPANGNWSIRYKYRATIWDKDTVTNNQVFTFDPRGKFVSVKTLYASPKERMIALVEKFFQTNYRDITARQTLEWGDVTTATNGDTSIRYKYRAVIWGREVVTNNQVFTFDAQDKFVSVRDVTPNGKHASALKLSAMQKVVTAQHLTPTIQPWFGKFLERAPGRKALARRTQSCFLSGGPAHMAELADALL